MPTAPDLIDPFHRELYKRLQIEYQDRAAALARGNANQNVGEIATTAEKYAAQVAYIRALQDVLDVCEELERDRYGARKRDDE